MHKGDDREQIVRTVDGVVDLADAWCRMPFYVESFPADERRSVHVAFGRERTGDGRIRLTLTVMDRRIPRGLAGFSRTPRRKDLMKILKAPFSILRSRSSREVRP